jgi:hypothetical protein
VTDLESLEKLLAEATAGPWRTTTSCAAYEYCSVEGPEWTVCQVIYDDDRRPVQGEDDDGKAIADARLIVALRNAAPELLAELKELRERVVAARADVFEEAAKVCEEYLEYDEAVQWCVNDIRALAAEGK